MKIYLDNCCLQRIWDDQSQARIQLETEAIQIILSHIKAGYLGLLNSVALEQEVERVPDEIHRALSRSILSQAEDFLVLDDIIESRANELRYQGLRGWDAHHAAFAEAHGAILISTDDRLLKKLRLISWKSLALNPINFVQEYLHDR
jgi:predicted nucleic acid-binding protein